ncbi:hypothetical protein BC828DRAFT_391032 [Blastocladiella britannica]|nr:hypothetical protein BC828DRAFT_391032 [Blastocladiella britannica]
MVFLYFPLIIKSAMVITNVHFPTSSTYNSNDNPCHHHQPIFHANGQSFCLGVHLAMNARTVIVAHRLWKRAASGNSAQYYKIMCFACVFLALEYTSNLFGYHCDYTGVGGDPDVAMDDCRRVSYGLVQLTSALSVGKTWCLLYVNWIRLKAVGQTMAPKTTLAAMILIAVDAVLVLAVNVTVPVDIAQYFYTGDSPPLLNVTAMSMLLAWQLYDEAVHVLVSLVFFWLVWKLSYGSPTSSASNARTTGVVPTNPTRPGGGGLIRSISRQLITPAARTMKSAASMLFHLSYKRKRRADLLRHLFAMIALILAAESTLIVAVNTLVVLQLVNDPMYSLVYLAESIRLRLSCEFLSRLADIMAAAAEKDDPGNNHGQEQQGSPAEWSLHASRF